MSGHRSLSDIQRDLEQASERQSLLNCDVSTQKVVDALFPEISWNRSIVWITAAQVIVFFVTCIVGGNFGTPTDKTLLMFGATYGPAIKYGQIWRFVTPIFLHAGIFHLLCNLVFILHMGLNVENKCGMINFLKLYFGAGIVGNMMTVLFQPCALAVGASTSGFGIIGALLAEIALAWLRMSETARRIFLINLGILAVVVFAISFIPTVDVWGHVGGLVAGVAISLWYNYEFENLPRWYMPVFLMTSFITAAVVIATPIRIWAFYMPCEMPA